VKLYIHHNWFIETQSKLSHSLASNQTFIQRINRGKTTINRSVLLDKINYVVNLNRALLESEKNFERYLEEELKRYER
jgi:hypothetical protein